MTRGQDENRLSDEALAVVRCFPPGGYGDRMEPEIRHGLRTITSDPTEALAELGDGEFVSQFIVPDNCGPARYGYRLTAKGRRLRAAMSADDAGPRVMRSSVTEQTSCVVCDHSRQDHFAKGGCQHRRSYPGAPQCPCPEFEVARPPRAPRAS